MTDATVATTWTGYAQPAGALPQVKHTHHGKLITLLVVGLLALSGVVTGVSEWVTPAHKNYVCPPDCGHPPTARPVASAPRYTGAGGAYSVSYFPSNSNLSTSKDSSGVTVKLLVGDGGAIRLFGTAAGGRTAQQVAGDLVGKAFPDAKRVYAVPNAVVGYQPGYGEVDDVYPQSSDGSYTHDRLVLMVAVKNNVALVAEALGPYDPASPGGSSDTGHPTGVSLAVAAFLLDPLVNSFMWHGDPPR